MRVQMGTRHHIPVRVVRTNSFHVGTTMVAAACIFGYIAPVRGAPADAPVKPAAEKTPGAASAETVAVAGRLIDGEGAPVAKARIWLAVEEKWEHTSQGPPVVAEGFSSAEGRFELAPLKSRIDEFVKGQSTQYQVWAWKPGFALVRHVTRGNPPAKPVEIRLPPESIAEFLLRNPDRSAASGATVRVHAIRFEDAPYQVIPEVVRERIALTSGANGRIAIRGLARENIVSLEFETPRLGRQVYSFHAQGRRIPTDLTLRKTGAIEGRLELPRGSHADLSQVKVRIATLENTAHGQDEYWAGEAIVRPDREGKFAIPGIAVGTIRVFVDEPDGLELRSDPLPEKLAVVAGETAQLEIPMGYAVKVTRSIQEAETVNPIAGVRVHMQYGVQHVYARTDGSGRFAAWILPGVPYHTVYDHADEYISHTASAINQTTVPAGDDEHELPPIEFVRGRTIEGNVVDPEGRPVADVRVGADWPGHREDFGVAEAGAAVNARRWGSTDAEGHFQIKGVFPIGRITLTPVRHEVILGKAVGVAAGDNRPVRLETEAFEFTSLRGRVVTPDGKPVAGADVVVKLYRNTQEYIAWRGVTDAAGRFRTPRHFPVQFGYWIMVQSRFRDVVSSRWQRPAESGDRFPDIEVDPAKLILREILPEPVPPDE